MDKRICLLLRCVNRVINWNKSNKRSSDLVARSLTFCESPPCRTNGRRLPVSSVSRTGHCAWIRGAKRFSDLIVSLSILLYIYYPLSIFYFTDHWNYPYLFYFNCNNSIYHIYCYILYNIANIIRIHENWSKIWNYLRILRRIRKIRMESHYLKKFIKTSIELSEMIIDICCSNFELIMSMEKFNIERKEKWFHIFVGRIYMQFIKLETSRKKFIILIFMNWILSG